MRSFSRGSVSNGVSSLGCGRVWKGCFGKEKPLLVLEKMAEREVLKDVFPDLKLTNTQWKMIVEIADKDPSSELVHFEQFIKIVEHCATKAKNQPRI